MTTKQETNKSRPDLRCLTITEPYWSEVKELATKECRSVSNYIRKIIREKYEEQKKGGVQTMSG